MKFKKLPSVFLFKDAVKQYMIDSYIAYYTYWLSLVYFAYVLCFS